MAEQQSILICGNFRTPALPLAAQCAEALEAMGHRVTRVESEDVVPRWQMTLQRLSKSVAKLFGAKEKLGNFYRDRTVAERMARISHAFNEAQPDWVLVIRGNLITPDVLQWMQEQGALCVLWWSKEPRTIHYLEQEKDQYDLTFCIHKDHIRDGIHYLPSFAADFSRYYPADREQYDHDMVFVGGWNPRRQRFVEAIADQDIALVGPNWLRKNKGSRPDIANKVFAYALHSEALIQLYQRARIVVNINQWDADEAAGTTLRIADVPACGPLLLTELNDGVSETFELEKEVVAFTDENDMRDKAIALLADEPRRKAIADAGLARVRAMPTYHDRMAVILAAVNERLAQHD